MFEVNIRFQIAALLILAMITADYIKTPHLKLISTRSFKILVGLTAANLCFDISTVYTITHMNTVPEWLNKLMHQLFIFSIIAVAFTYFIYVLMLSRNQKRLEKGQLIPCTLPLLTSLFFIIFGDIDYFVSDMGVYSYGMIVTPVYICATLYALFALIISIVKNDNLNKAQRISIQLGVCIMFAFTLIQLFFPTLLLSGIGLSLMVLSVYFSFENQRENFDTEVGCFSRVAFHRVMSENYETKKPMFLINVTCTNYSEINSIFGHDIGHKALAYVAEKIKKETHQSAFRSQTSTLSFFMSASEAAAADTAAYLDRCLWEDKSSQLKVNVRISVMDLRKYAENPDEAYGLMSFITSDKTPADNVVFLNEDIVGRKKRRDRIEQLLIEATETNGFEMYYQPIYSTEHGTYHSCEALIRMKSTSELGYISPEEFIPIAEQKGLIFKIGDCVVEQVADFARRSRTVSEKLEYIEVNLSGLQASAPDLDKRLENIVRQHGISPSFLNLEITETAIIGSETNLKSNITALRQKGFSFSMDDFGTGYSNLAQITKIHYDLVKIDKSLIWPAFGENASEKAERLLSSVINMLKAIDAKIVAEGVETEEMASYLADKGVEYLQGYYFSKPVPEAAFEEILEKT